MAITINRYSLRHRALYCVVFWLLVAGALFPPGAAADAAAKKEGEYPVIQWTDLIPADDLEALLNPPAYLEDIEDGSPEDQLGGSAPENVDADAKRYQQALISTRVRPEFDGRKVKIPGYVVPLNFDDEMVITEFFLVPFFGACIHVPPPPPNQMVYIVYRDGLQLESLYDPFYIEGTLKIESHDSGEMGASAYTMNVAKIYPYTD